MQCSTHGNLLVLDTLDHLRKLLVLVGVHEAIDQVAAESDATSDQTHKRGIVLVGRLLFCVIADELRDGRRQLDHQEERRRHEHDLGILRNGVVVADAAATDTSPLLGTVVRLAVLDGHSAEDDADEPWQGQEHHCAACEGAYAHRHRLLRVWANSRKKHHHAIWDRTQDGEHDAADDTSDRRHEHQKLRAAGDEVRGLVQNDGVDAGDEQQLRIVAETGLDERRLHDIHADTALNCSPRSLPRQGRIVRARTRYLVWGLVPHA
mmetsp:Transcript_13822/g.38588  ORF Transcript_13822/g.38588 Transcript_13822/m.38588 type:complete len:264 (-) Transcript_13822:30-821(-)